ncbi:MAG: hypothetical protein N4A63_13105 [Vallitalea sp.]|jgi:hypothetical protein|nr:hypothetical protein [Vallitalea sp.]
MKKRIIGGIIIILGICLVGIKLYPNSIEQAMQDANIHSKQILYEVVTDKGLVVFYEPENYQNGCDVGLIEKKLFKYKWVFGVGTMDFINDSRELPNMYGNIGEVGNNKGFPLVYGTILNSDIVEVQVQTCNNEFKNADIVETNLGKIWYYFLEEQTTMLPKIIAKGSNEEIIFRRGF